MTIKDKAEQMLFERGMFKEQAEEVVRRVMADPANEAMQGRWNDDVEGYPAPLMAAIWLSVKGAALDYIVENYPKAWFRSQFEEAKV